MSVDSHQSSPSHHISSSNPFRDANSNMQDDMLDDDESDHYENYGGATRDQDLGKQVRVPPPMQIQAPKRYVLAIDYGTTFTGFAFSTTSTNVAELDSIEVLQEWTSNMSNQSQVPSVISYSKSSNGAAQWGSDLTEDAITLSRTKLELEPQSTLEELDMLLQVLRGTGFLTFKAIRDAEENPTYTSKSPEAIVSDYLTKVFECASKVISLEGIRATGVPVDIVLTVPVGWSYVAYNSMFKALKTAGFAKTNIPTLQDTMMLTEAEAACYFTARDIAERENDDFLEVDDCFILCDAGGGTVDLVAFEVTQTHPHLEFKKITEPTGGRYGSSLIDQKFKEWLRNAIGKQYYSILDPENADTRRISPHTVETGPMRDLMRRFNTAKAQFSGLDKSDIKLDLARVLGEPITVQGRVAGGELRISRHDMKELMDPCVSGVIKLIKAQVDEASRLKSRRVRDIIMVGGFSSSPYLQQVLAKTPSITKNQIGLRRPDDSLTAVVRGATIYGVEKAKHKTVTYMSTITRSYGVAYRISSNKKKYEWIIRKGDLVLSNQTSRVTSRIFYADPQCYDHNGRGYFNVFTYQQRKGDDHVPEWEETASSEVKVVNAVEFDLSGFLDSHGDPLPDSLIPGIKSSPPSKHSIGPLTWQFDISSDSLHVEILIKGQCVGSCEIDLETDRPAAHKSSLPSWQY